MSVSVPGSAWFQRKGHTRHPRSLPSTPLGRTEVNENAGSLSGATCRHHLVLALLNTPHTPLPEGSYAAQAAPELLALLPLPPQVSGSRPRPSRWVSGGRFTPRWGPLGTEPLSSPHPKPQPTSQALPFPPFCAPLNVKMAPLGLKELKKPR